MEKVELSYETKFDLIRSYIEGELPQEEFNRLCNRVFVFEKQYQVQKETFEIVKTGVLPKTNKLFLFFYNLNELLKEFPKIVDKTTENIKQVINIPDIDLEFARSSGSEDEVKKEFQFETIEDISVNISELVRNLYSGKDISRVEVKLEFAEKEKYIEIQAGENIDDTSKKIIEIIERYEVEKLSKINVYIF